MKKIKIEGEGEKSKTKTGGGGKKEKITLTNGGKFLKVARKDKFKVFLRSGHVFLVGSVLIFIPVNINS